MFFFRFTASYVGVYKFQYKLDLRVEIRHIVTKFGRPSSYSF